MQFNFRPERPDQLTYNQDLNRLKAETIAEIRREMLGQRSQAGAGSGATNVTLAAPSAPAVDFGKATNVAFGITRLSVPAVSANDPIAAGDNDPRLSDSRSPNGPAAGDLSGSYPAPTVAKLQGQPVSSSAPTTDYFLKWTGTEWAPSAITGAGTGDMTKAIYDTDNDGKVDVAELADAAPWAGITGKPATFPPDAHTHPSTDVTDFSEAVDDRVAALLTAGTNVTVTYDDALNKLTIAASGGSGSGNTTSGTLIDGNANGTITGDTVNRVYIDGTYTATHNVETVGGTMQLVQNKRTAGDVTITDAGALESELIGGPFALAPGSYALLVRVDDELFSPPSPWSRWYVVYTGSSTSAAGGGGSFVRDIVFVPAGMKQTWTGMPVAGDEWLGSIYYRIKADLTGFTQVRLVASMHVTANTGSTLNAEYSADGGSTWLDMEDGPGSGPSIGIGQAQGLTATVGAWLNLPAGAKADVTLRLWGVSGSGSASSPEFSSVSLQFK